MIFYAKDIQIAFKYPERWLWYSKNFQQAGGLYHYVTQEICEYIYHSHPEVIRKNSNIYH